MHYAFLCVLYYIVNIFGEKWTILSILRNYITYNIYTYIVIGRMHKIRQRSRFRNRSDFGLSSTVSRSSQRSGGLLAVRLTKLRNWGFSSPFWKISQLRPQIQLSPDRTVSPWKTGTMLNEAVVVNPSGIVYYIFKIVTQLLRIRCTAAVTFFTAPVWEYNIKNSSF